MSEKQLHIALIPDGNRRWARTHSLLPWKGHEKAVANFRTLTEWCREHPRIGTLTVWCFSTENWKRDPEEIRRLMEMLETYLRDERDLFQKHKSRFVHSGRKDRIPTSLAQLIKEVEEETRDFTDFTLHLAVDYGGMDEVTRAVRKLGDAAAATPEEIRAHLDHPEVPDIDLVIRSSGEKRTSNFFLWQSAYAEWLFLEKHFPEIGTTDLEAAIAEFDTRKRRYGS